LRARQHHIPGSDGKQVASGGATWSYTSGMQDLLAGDLTVAVSELAGGLRLDWKGKSNAREPAKVLAPFFVEVAKRAATLGAKPAVELHFEALEHFNSSTITALIQFIQTSRARGLQLIIVFDAAQKWQRLSFDALRIFDKGDGLLIFKSPG
jgi:hypothetical protein